MEDKASFLGNVIYLVSFWAKRRIFASYGIGSFADAQDDKFKVFDDKYKVVDDKYRVVDDKYRVVNDN